MKMKMLNHKRRKNQQMFLLKHHQRPVVEWPNPKDLILLKQLTAKKFDALGHLQVDHIMHLFFLLRNLLS